MVRSSTSAPRRGQPARMRLSSSVAGPAATAPAASKRAASRAAAAAGTVTWRTNGAPSVARAVSPPSGRGSTWPAVGGTSRPAATATERARTGQAIDGYVGVAVADAGEARGHRARENRQGALAPPAVRRDGVAHRGTQPGRPAVHHDHPLGGQQGAIHERAVTGELDVVREQSLEGRDGPGAVT